MDASEVDEKNPPEQPPLQPPESTALVPDTPPGWWALSPTVADQKARVALQRAKLEAKLQEACSAIRKHNESILQDETSHLEPEVDVHVHMVSPERVVPVPRSSSFSGEHPSVAPNSTISWSDSHSSGDGDSVHDHVDSCRTLHVVRQKFVTEDGTRYHYTGPVKVVPDGETEKLKLIPHGSGEIWFAGGQHYRGQVLNGQRHGHGENTWDTIVSANDSHRTQTYRGLWKSDHREGFGTLIYVLRQGNVERERKIVGTWSRGRLDGRASMSFEDGSHFDGSVVQGKRHGRGTETFPDGKVYSGQYANGTPDGYGTLQQDRGRIYRGQFKLGHRHGFGLQIWPHKSYEGEWHHNIMHGRGKVLWSDRSCYTGQLQAGKPHGVGSHQDARGNKYVGKWKRGLRHGDGKEYTAIGDMYHGGFYRGRRNGFGRLLYADGSVYSGGWKRGLRCGRGILVRANGYVEHCGHFDNDEPIFRKLLETRDDIDVVTNVTADDDDEAKVAIRDLRTMTELTEDFLLYVDETTETRVLI